MHAFDVLGDPVRRRILELLADGEASAGAVGEAVSAEFAISQPAVSQHLKVLREHGFVTVRPVGQRRLYAVRAAPLREVDDWLGRFRAFWEPHLDALATEIARGKRTRRTPSDDRPEQESPLMDVRHEIEATDRRVGTRTLEAGTASVVTLTRSFPTDVADLWEACTDPDRLRRWFLPVSGDLRLGGRYQLEGNAGGTVTVCDPPRGFDATWEMGEQVSWIELRLAPDGEGARLELAHIAHVDDDFWPTYGPGAVGIGWDLGLLGLATHIGERRTVDPAAFEAWTISPEGREFVTAAGRAWERASVTAGVPVEEASGMADRTIAFYTGAQA